MGLSKKSLVILVPNSYPSYNILIVGVVALAAGFLDLEHVVNLISFGALTAFTFVNSQ
jgi:hypothetical protein